jgi:gas vesicle protein
MSTKKLTILANAAKSKRARRKTAETIAIGVGVAAAAVAAGYATGVLTAPNSGKATRKAIKDKVVKAEKDVRKAVKRQVGSVSHKRDDVKNDLDKGHRKITKDIHDMAQSISADLNQSAK